MRHYRVDTKLARGLTMAEARAILRRDPALHPDLHLRDERHPVRAAAKPVAWRYRAGRRPAAAYARWPAEAVDGLCLGDPATVARDWLDLPSPAGHPAFQRRHIQMLPTSPDEGCRTLGVRCVAVTLDELALSLNQVDILTVDLHVIERFHQRTRSGLVRDALSAFGACILADMALILRLQAIGADLPGRSFAFPFADGLALATCVDRPSGEVDPFAIVQVVGRPPIDYERMPHVRLRRTMDPTEPHALVKTFVGPGEMKPRQARLREAILGIASRHAGYLAHVRDLLTASGRTLPDLRDPAVEPRLVRQGVSLTREIEAVFRDPEMLLAMTGPARGVA